MNNNNEAAAQELLRAMQYMISEAMKQTTKIYSGVILSQNGDGTWNVQVNGTVMKLPSYGTATMGVGSVVKVVVPQGNNNVAYIDVWGGGSSPTPPSPITLPIASTTTLGGIKVGDGLDIDATGVLSVLTDYLNTEDIVQIIDSSSQEDKIPSAKAVNTALSEYAKTNDIPTKVSQLANDVGYTDADDINKTLKKYERITPLDGNEYLKVFTIPKGTATNVYTEIFRLKHPNDTIGSLSDTMTIRVTSNCAGKIVSHDLKFGNCNQASMSYTQQLKSVNMSSNEAGYVLNQILCFYENNAASKNDIVYAVTLYSAAAVDDIDVTIEFIEAPEHMTIDFSNAGAAITTISIVSGVTYSTGGTTLRNVRLFDNGNISGTAGSAGYINSYYSGFISNYHYAGEALTAARIIFQSANGKFYMPTNKTVPYDKDILIMCSTAAVSKDAAITYTNTRCGVSLAASYLTSSFGTKDTITRYHKYYAQFTCTDGKFYSDNILRDESKRIVGKWYLYLGHCSRSTSYVEVPQTSVGHLEYYAGTAEGKLSQFVNDVGYLTSVSETVGTDGQVLGLVNGSPTWVDPSGEGSAVGKIVIGLEQIISSDPLQVQMTPEQMTILEENDFIKLDASSLGEIPIICTKTEMGADYLHFQSVFYFSSDFECLVSVIDYDRETGIGQLTQDRIPRYNYDFPDGSITLGSTTLTEEKLSELISITSAEGVGF